MTSPYHQDAGERLSATNWNAAVDEINKFNSGPGMYEDSTGVMRRPVPGGGLWQHFELKVDLTPGSRVDAYLRTYDSASSSYVTDTDTEFEVWDALGIHRGRAKDKFSSPHDAGSRGVVAQVGSSWEIIRITPHALLIYGLLTADLASGESTFTISGATVMQPIGGIITDQNPAQPITIRNKGFEGDDNGHCVAAWDESAGELMAVDVVCPA